MDNEYTLWLDNDIFESICDEVDNEWDDEQGEDYEEVG